jgi:hypothetical protein
VPASPNVRLLILFDPLPRLAAIQVRAPDDLMRRPNPGSARDHQVISFIPDGQRNPDTLRLVSSMVGIE